jgi:heterodisulfide reductase subunit A
MSPKSEKSVVVIGGGVAGMTAAIELAKLGHKVQLVEMTDRLGGLVVHHGAWVTGERPQWSVIAELKKGLEEHKANITVHMSTKVTKFEGTPPKAKATLEGSGGKKEMDVAAVIIATGAETFDPARLPEYKYGKSPSVITTLEFGPQFIEKGTIPLHPKTRNPLKSVGFVQCVGSRMYSRGNPWCSNICCMATVKQALILKERSPKTEITVYYIDIRVVGRAQEAFYWETKQAGVKYVRGIPSEVIAKKNGNVLVRAEDASMGKIIEREHDLLVLSVGLEPKGGTEELMKAFGIKSVDGFIPIESPELNPVKVWLDGLYVAGTAESPKGIKESVTQARAAALEVEAFLRKK